MQESQILFQVSQIVSRTNSFTGAVEEIRPLLKQSLGAQSLTIDLSADARVAAERPPGSFYAVPLRAGGRELGTLVVPADLPERVWSYVGQQLGMLLERAQLSTDRARLEAELAAMHEDLATRKAVHRAQGILVSRRGITPASARRWISQQAHETGSTVLQVAEQVVAVENARRLEGQPQQRIA
jgi:GAF domain-containing protein